MMMSNIHQFFRNFVCQNSAQTHLRNTFTENTVRDGSIGALRNTVAACDGYIRQERSNVPIPRRKYILCVGNSASAKVGFGV